MRNEGGFQKEDGAVHTPGHPSRMVNGNVAVPTRETVEVDGSNQSSERELSDVASGASWMQHCQPPHRPNSPVLSQKGLELMEELSKAYQWREQFNNPSQEFLGVMDHLYMECQLHLTALSSQDDLESRREADAIVSEMVALRNHWGPQLLPSSTCNAFVRERIPLTLGVDQRQFRIDCAQFFEPVPFYSNQRSSSPGELMKLYRFSVYDEAENDVVLRYFLERSNITQFYHVLCFMDNNCHGQVKPFGIEPPPYWEVRQSMLEDLNLRLLDAVSPGSHPVPQPLAVTVFPSALTDK